MQDRTCQIPLDSIQRLEWNLPRATLRGGAATLHVDDSFAFMEVFTVDGDKLECKISEHGPLHLKLERLRETRRERSCHLFR